jgi:hypothetical protein
LGAYGDVIQLTKLKLVAQGGDMKSLLKLFKYAAQYGPQVEVTLRKKHYNKVIPSDPSPKLVGELIIIISPENSFDGDYLLQHFAGMARKKLSVTITQGERT